jgi:hypothetical protein
MIKEFDNFKLKINEDGYSESSYFGYKITNLVVRIKELNDINGNFYPDYIEYALIDLMDDGFISDIKFSKNYSLEKTYKQVNDVKKDAYYLKYVIYVDISFKKLDSYESDKKYRKIYLDKRDELSTQLYRTFDHRVLNSELSKWNAFDTVRIWGNDRPVFERISDRFDIWPPKFLWLY